MTDIVDGKAIARSIQEEVTEGVRQLEAASAVLPGLAVVLVGDDSVTTSDDELLALIQTLNSDTEVLVAAFLPRWRALPVTPCPSPRS
jgi:5,10-methylene-tetrahydrofolate dehydrogenase/methenyl tetrahydrofolate cyclohydrolase